MLGLARTVQTELYRITQNTTKLGRASNSHMSDATKQLRVLADDLKQANAALRSVKIDAPKIDIPKTETPKEAYLPSNISVPKSPAELEVIAAAADAAADGMSDFAVSTADAADELSDLSDTGGATEGLLSRMFGRVRGLADGFSLFKRTAEEANVGAMKLGKAVDYATDKTTRADTAFQKIAKSVTRIAFYRVVRDIIKSIGEAYREGRDNLVQYSALLNSLGSKDAAEANWTMSQFATIGLWVKDTVGSALMPAFNMLVPVINAVASAFVWAANAVNQFLEALRGSATWTKALKYPVDYAEKLNGVGKAAKEAKKQIFGFDELNIFTAPTNGGGGAADALDYSSLFAEAEVNDGLKSTIDNIKATIAELEVFLAGAALAVGMILISTGHLELGVGAIIAGAATYWHSQGVTGDTLGATIQKKMESLVAFTAPVLLGLGTLFLLTGHIGLGIGAILGGIGALGISEAGGFTDKLPNDIKTKLETLTTTISIFTLAFGVMLALGVPSQMPLALGLIAAGVGGLVTPLVVDWDKMGVTLGEKLLLITGIVSAAMLALGALLVFSGANVPLGLGLLVAGAIGQTVMTSLGWEEVPKEISKVVGTITLILSGAALALGAVMFFGAGDIRGLFLMMAGATGLLAAAKEFDLAGWAKEKIDSLSQKVEGFFTDIKDKALTAGSEFVGNLIQGIKDKWSDLTSWLSRQKLTVNGVTKISSNMGSTFSVSGNADGGFVDSGQMFVARENGIPEFVGTWGNQTAVANNQQIVEGIAAGVANAMTNTNSAIYQMANAVVDAIANKEINTTVISDRDIYQSAQRGKTLSGRTVYA